MQTKSKLKLHTLPESRNMFVASVNACPQFCIAHLDIVPEVYQILADGDEGFGVTREQHILLPLGVEDAPHLAVILQFLHITTPGLQSSPTDKLCHKTAIA